MKRRTVHLALAMAIGLGCLGSAAAHACSLCHDFTVYLFGLPVGSIRQTCLPVINGVTGVTECSVYSVGSSTFCLEGGIYCSTMVVLGGNGDCDVDVGAPCPPECGSCNRVAP